MAQLTIEIPDAQVDRILAVYGDAKTVKAKLIDCIKNEVISFEQDAIMQAEREKQQIAEEVKQVAFDKVQTEITAIKIV